MVALAADIKIDHSRLVAFRLVLVEYGTGKWVSRVSRGTHERGG